MTQKIFHRSLVERTRATTTITMFRAIGVILILWYLSHLFTGSFTSLDSALSETFETLEVAAVASREHIQ